MRVFSAVLHAVLLCLARFSTGKKVAVSEVVVDSAIVDIQWLGEDRKTVLLQTTKGRLYRSTNGGDVWTDITDNMKADVPGGGDANKPITIDTMIKNPADTNIVMVAGTERSHFISINAGATWRRIRQRATIHTFMFHKTRPKWALLSTWTDACEASKKKKENSDDDDDKGPCTHMLYITKDLGRTFSLVTSYVVQFSWGAVDKGQQDRIYLTHFRQKKGDQPKLTLWNKNVDFVLTDDAGRSLVRLIYRGNKFLISHNFIFVAKLSNSNEQTVQLMASSDGGVTFRAAKLPQELQEKSYTVLDTSEGAVILHVNHGSKEPYGVGNVYVSDASGVRFTLSLPNNVRSTGGDCEFDKVLSMEGVYLANFKDIPRTGDTPGDKGTNSKKEDANREAEELEQESTGTEVDKKHTSRSKGKDETVVRTVISFDKGGMWSYLKPPKISSTGKKIECQPDRCWLHLHGITNFHNYAPFYSSENAVGIIMGTGNVGAYLRFEPDQVNTYLSRDGGLSWVEAHKGAFIYEFGDHGGLLVMADDIRKTKQVVFSWNEGQSWFDFDLGKFPVEVDNIVTEPNSTSTKFLLYGTRGDSGVIFHMDFDALEQPLCKGVWAADSVSSDYETWMPSDSRNDKNKNNDEKCMLGRQVSYTRRKPASECFNGEKFERPVTKKNCACVAEDFDCELGFTRQVGSTECKPAEDRDNVVEPPDVCKDGDHYFTEAYRKVVGDSCEGGWSPQKVMVACPSKGVRSRGAMSMMGTIFVVGGVLGLFSFMQSDKAKGMFANSGFDNFNSVNYAGIGARAPESAVDSVGTRFDADFIEDDFADSAPQLMSYSDNSRDRDGDRREEEVQMPRRTHVDGGAATAASSVPKLQAPPGGGAGAAADDGDLDLL